MQQFEVLFVDINSDMLIKVIGGQKLCNRKNRVRKKMFYLIYCYIIIYFYSQLHKELFKLYVYQRKTNVIVCF